MITTTSHGAVRLVTIDRPEVLNAFDSAHYRALADAIEAVRTDDTAHVAVVTGVGRAFSTGQDLVEMAELASGGSADSGFPDLLEAVQRFDKPLVAAVNGYAVGIGFTILPHCDLVLAARSARFRTPFAELGVPPEAASSYLFPMRMGWQRAAYVLFTSAWLDAEQAVDCGIALDVVADDELLDRALSLAASVAANPLAALRAIKGAMLAAQGPAVRAARVHEEAAFAELLGGADARAALDAFNG